MEHPPQTQVQDLAGYGTRFLESACRSLEMDHKDGQIYYMVRKREVEEATEYKRACCGARSIRRIGWVGGGESVVGEEALLLIRSLLSERARDSICGAVLKPQGIDSGGYPNWDENGGRTESHAAPNSGIRITIVGGGDTTVSDLDSAICRWMPGRHPPVPCQRQRKHPNVNAQRLSSRQQFHWNCYLLRF